MGDVRTVAAGVRDVGASDADVEQALGRLRRERRFTVDAAYAFARRRDMHPTWRRAADLLELSVAERNRRAYRAPRRWVRAEVAIVGVVVLVLFHIGTQLWLHGLRGLWHPGTWIWPVYAVLWWHAARRNPPANEVVPLDMSEIETRLGHVLAQGRAMAVDGAEVDEIADAMRTGAGGDGDALDARMAAIVLARTQRRLAPSFERHRKALFDAADRARRRQLQRIGQTEGIER